MQDSFLWSISSFYEIAIRHLIFNKNQLAGFYMLQQKLNLLLKNLQKNLLKNLCYLKQSFNIVLNCSYNLGKDLFTKLIKELDFNPAGGFFLGFFFRSFPSNCLEKMFGEISFVLKLQVINSYNPDLILDHQ